MVSLYELSTEYQQLASMDAGDDEAFREALDETLNVNGDLIEDKIESTIIVSRQLEADAEACKAEAKRLSERAASFQRNADACKERVRMAMENVGKDKIKRQLFTITRVAGRPICTIEDSENIPAQYTKTVTTTSPVKADILKALKAGEVVPGCKLDTGKASLRIS